MDKNGDFRREIGERVPYSIRFRSCSDSLALVTTRSYAIALLAGEGRVGVDAAGVQVTGYPAAESFAEIACLELR